MRTRTLARPAVRAHRPIPQFGDPTTCWCGLPPDTRNARHRVDPELEAAYAEADRRRTGERA